MPAFGKAVLGVSTTNYQLKGIYHGGSWPHIYFLGRKSFQIMHSWRLGVTMALMACGLGWSKSAYSRNDVAAATCIPSFWVLEIMNRWNWVTKYVSASMCEFVWVLKLDCRTRVRKMTLSVTLSHFKRMTVNTIFLYANPSSYLNSPNTLSVSDVSCSFGTVDTNDNGTQISWVSILITLRKILGPFVDLVFYEGYILGPELVGLAMFNSY